MRAFLAFDISETVRERLAVAQRELKSTGAEVSVVARENLHFTVKFLGDVPDQVAGIIDERLASLNLRAIDVTVNGLGAFPDRRHPRVVWAGVNAADEATVSQTAAAILVALKDVGKPEDKSFRPHITLARVKSPRNIVTLVDFVTKNSGREFGPTRISSLKLKSSQLTPNGSVYTDVREYALA